MIPASVFRLFTSHLLSRDIKIRVHKTVLYLLLYTGVKTDQWHCWKIIDLGCREAGTDNNTCTDEEGRRSRLEMFAWSGSLLFCIHNQLVLG